MMSMQYTNLCTEETKMCKLTKNLPIHGGVGFSAFRVKVLTRERKFRGPGVKTPVRAMLWDI